MTSRLWAQGLSGLVYPMMFGPALLGPQLVLNGDFGNATGWSLGTGYAISGGQLVCTNTAGYAYQTQPNQLAGQIYQYDFDIISSSLGTIRPYVGATPVFGPSVSAPGHYSGQLVATSSNELGLNANSTNFTGVIDNFSMRQIG